MSSVDLAADWRRLVLDGWPAVTASDLLQDSQDIWLAEGLAPPKDDEAVALAAMGRLVRYGESIAVNLPVSREATLPRLAFYLHRLRLDAAQGLVRSPWLNRVEMAHRHDLLVFGRPRRMLRDFVTSSARLATCTSKSAKVSVVIPSINAREVGNLCAQAETDPSTEGSFLAVLVMLECDFPNPATLRRRYVRQGRRRRT